MLTVVILWAALAFVDFVFMIAFFALARPGRLRLRLENRLIKKEPGKPPDISGWRWIKR